MLLETIIPKLPSHLNVTDIQQRLLNDCEIQTIPADTLIMDEGKYIKVVPIVLSGLVRVFKQEEGKELLLYYINPKESCIMSITSSISNEKSQVKAMTEEESELLLIPSRYLAEWQKLYPSLNLFILDLYKKRFEDILKAFNSVAFQKVDERLINHLKEKVKLSGSNIIKITHQSLADELGSARETISRFLKKLEHDGKVKLLRGKIEIIQL